MDDSDQRLEALKKAYADVILNISKEAAARVMAAEAKAQRMEHEKQKTKEEAIQMMVRLKKKMDDAISEANMLSRNQQQKNDELEAQLQEAEDIVTELREKLRYEQAKSDRVTRREMQHLHRRDYAIPEEEFVYHRQAQSIPFPPSEFQKDSIVASYKENPYLNQRTKYPQCSSESQVRNLYGAMHELPSIIQRSKKHNLSRNACTQRIQACERNVLDNELSLSRKPDDASSQGNVEGAKKDSSTCKVTFNEVHKMFNIEGKEVVSKDGCISCWYEVQPAKLIPEVVATATKQRKIKSSKTNFNDKEGDNEKLISNGEPPVKSAAKYRKNKISSGKKTPTKLFMKGHETPGVPHSDPSPKSVENDPQPNEDPTLTMQKLSSDIAGMETRPECAKTTETNSNDKEGDTEKLISKGVPAVVPVINISVPSVQEGPSTESSDIQVSKSNLKKVDEPVLQSKLEKTDAPSKGSTVQYFKYTFQRKRKRQTLGISGGHVSADNHAPERRKDTQNPSEEPEKSSLVADPSIRKQAVSTGCLPASSLSERRNDDANCKSL